MSRGDPRPHRGAAATAVVVLAVALVGIFAAGPSSHTSMTLAADTSCPTYAYGGQSLPCSSSTTSASSTTVARASASLEASYFSGKLTVKACGFTSAASGHTAQLYEGGNAVPAASGGMATIDSGGCATFDASLCLAEGGYQLAVVDQTPVQGGTADVTGTVTVSAAQACRAASLASGSGSGGSGLAASGGLGTSGSVSSGGGPLASTGSYIAVACLVGVGLIAVGYAFVRRSRWQKRRQYRYMRLR